MYNTIVFPMNPMNRSNSFRRHWDPVFTNLFLQTVNVWWCGLDSHQPKGLGFDRDHSAPWVLMMFVDAPSRLASGYGLARREPIAYPAIGVVVAMAH